MANECENTKMSDYETQMYMLGVGRLQVYESAQRATLAVQLASLAYTLKVLATEPPPWQMWVVLHLASFALTSFYLVLSILVTTMALQLARFETARKTPDSIHIFSSVGTEPRIQERLIWAFLATAPFGLWLMVPILQAVYIGLWLDVVSFLGITTVYMLSYLGFYKHLGKEPSR